MRYIKQLILILVIISAIVPISLAAENNSSIKDLNFALNNLEYIQNKYNSAANSVPKLVKSIFGNEIIQLIIKRNNGYNEILSLETQKGLIKSISKETLPIYTLQVNVDESTINKILSSNDQINTGLKALREKEITYKSLKFKTKTKMFFSRIFLFFWK